MPHEVSPVWLKSISISSAATALSVIPVVAGTVAFSLRPPRGSRDALHWRDVSSFRIHRDPQCIGALLFFVNKVRQGVNNDTSNGAGAVELRVCRESSGPEDDLKVRQTRLKTGEVNIGQRPLIANPHGLRSAAKGNGLSASWLLSVWGGVRPWFESAPQVNATHV